MLNFKDQRGSITFFILSSCLFFIASVTGVFMYTQSKQIAIDREYRQIKDFYEGNEETIVDAELTIEKIKENTKKGMLETVTVKVKDGDNVNVTVPAGFTITKDSPNKAIEGIIITDKVDNAGNTTGNEFVWIPINYNLTVNGTNKIMAKPASGEYSGKDNNNRVNYEGVFYNFETVGGVLSSSQMEETSLGSEKNREPDTLITYDNNPTHLNVIKSILASQTDKYKDIDSFRTTMQEDYNEMIESIRKYGGFYVSRYEMGKQDKSPLSKKGAVTTSLSEQGNSWYGLYSIAKNYTNSSNSVKSSMIWGSQYDAMLNFALIGNDKAKLSAITNGNHTGKVKNTGDTASDKIINIFDLEGNCFEWTLEAFKKEYRMRRGGSYYSEEAFAPTARDTATVPDGKYATYSSRFTLYIN